MAERYPNVTRYFSETPWAIRPEKLVAIRELIGLRAAGGRFTPEEVEARIGEKPVRASGGQTASVAVIPIYGTIMPRASSFADVSGGGGTSVEGLAEALRSAVSDPAIDAILLDIDSPGGSTDLIPEFAAQVRDATRSKPVVAIANTDMASAAYWIGSQADELVVTPSGLVGSIGVFAAHEDVSGALEREGVRTTLISAGKYKVESNPYAPLSDEARAAIQGRVDDFYGMFTRDVAKGRGVSTDAVRGGFGEGRIVTAQAAVKAGMADRVDTFEATVQRLIQEASGRARGGGQARADGAPPPTLADAEIDTNEAATSGLSFARTALAVRDQAVQLATDARALCDPSRTRGLSAAKRDALTAAADAIDELVSSGAALRESAIASLPAPALSDGQRAFLETVRSTL